MDIRIRQLGKRFGDFAALDGVSLDIRSGELLALLGPSGSGKTTLLRAFAGLEQPEQGHILFGGEDATGLSVQARRAGFVFQHYALFKHMTVAANIAFGLEVRRGKERWPKARIAARVEELLALVQLEGLGGRYPTQLSGGQRQRVALARALAIEPRVLLLDEPFGALDAQVRRDLRRWLRELHDRTGLTTVFVTHDQEEALELADRVAILNKGRLVREGTVSDLMSDGEQLVLKVGPVDTALAILGARASLSGDGVRVAATRAEGPGLIRLLVQGGVDIHEARWVGTDLEGVFFTGTGAVRAPEVDHAG